MITALSLITFGAFLTWLAAMNWRHRHEEKISLTEAAILKTTGQEPLPLTKFDKVVQWFNVIMATILGPILLIAGIAGLLGLIGR